MHGSWCRIAVPRPGDGLLLVLSAGVVRLCLFMRGVVKLVAFFRHEMLIAVVK